MELRAGVVRQVVGRQGRRIDLLVDIDPGPGDPSSGRAWAFCDLSYEAWFPGQRVLLNTTAVSLGLGTGGQHVVVAPLDPPPLAGGWATPPASRRHGHIMKLRYTPVQLAVMAAEEPAGPYHRAVRDAPDLRGLPVAVVSLHSMVGVVAAACRWAAGCSPDLKVAYVMTDSAALPAHVSRYLHLLRRARIIGLVITSGQAFGGDMEAVHPASALAVAQRAGADVVILGPGPGVVGTATALGHTCLEAASLCDLAGALGAAPVLVPRLSLRDARARHRGLSHHDRLAFGRITARPALLVLPGSLPGRFRSAVIRQLSRSGLLARHRVVEVDPAPVRPALFRLPVAPESMGRTPQDDPPFFDACLSAGRVLAMLWEAASPAAGAGGSS